MLCDDRDDTCAKFIKTLGMSVTIVYMVRPTYSHKYNPLKPMKQACINFTTTNHVKRRQLLKCEQLLRYVDENESNMSQRKDNMKTTLIRVNASKSDNRKHEIDTCENNSARKK